MSEESSFVVYAALAANLGIAVAKFLVAAVTGSSAMFAEAVHSVADTGNEILLLVGMRRARRPPDAKHPFGHGKELYFWGLLVAMLLFAVGGGMSILKGIEHWHERELRGSVGWTYAVLGLAFALELGSFVIAVRKLAKARAGRTFLETWRESKDPTVFTVVAEDAAALTGILVAFGGILASRLSGNPVFDAAASLVIGAMLLLVAVALAYENRGLLIGESARAPLVDDVRRIIERDPAVRAAGPLLTMHLGPREVLLDADLEFVSPISGEELRRAVRRIEEAIRGAHPSVTRIYIEAASLR
jgi:cation diffusion facilitator family transporter